MPSSAGSCACFTDVLCTKLDESKPHIGWQLRFRLSLALAFSAAAATFSFGGASSTVCFVFIFTLGFYLCFGSYVHEGISFGAVFHSFVSNGAGFSIYYPAHVRNLASSISALFDIGAHGWCSVGGSSSRGFRLGTAGRSAGLASSGAAALRRSCEGKRQCAYKEQKEFFHCRKIFCDINCSKGTLLTSCSGVMTILTFS